MEQNNVATIIHSAYPDLPVCDVFRAIKNQDIVQSAFKLALKNTYTHDKIRTLCGFNLLTADVNFDASKINPFYKIKPHPTDDEYHTFIDINISAKDYAFASEVLSHIQPHEVLPHKITSVFNPRLSAKRIRKDIFQDITSVPFETKEKERIQKQGLDSFLTQMIRLTSAQETFDSVFRDKISGYFHLHQPYRFKGNESQTILEVCLKNNLPSTALAVINELNSNQKLIDSIRLPAIQTMFQNELSKSCTSSHKQSCVKQVMNHLEKILPSDIYLKDVTQKKTPWHWQNDFQLS